VELRNRGSAILACRGANGVVYFDASNGSLNAHNASGSVYALNARTGAKLWSYAVGSLSDFSAAIAVANGVVYVASSGITISQLIRWEGNVFALNASTGALLWNHAVEEDAIPVGSPAVANGVVYFGSQAFSGAGQFYALNASTGAKLWSYDWFPHPPWRMGWSISAPLTATCTP